MRTDIEPLHDLLPCLYRATTRRNHLQHPVWHWLQGEIRSQVSIYQLHRCQERRQRGLNKRRRLNVGFPPLFPTKAC